MYARKCRRRFPVSTPGRERFVASDSWAETQPTRPKSRARWWKYERRRGREELSFGGALEREEERTSDTRGLGPYTRNQIAPTARDRASYEAVSYNRRVSPAIARPTEWHDCNGPGFAGQQDLSAHRGAESGSSRAVRKAQPARDLPTRTLHRTSDT
jgi:hypothetical protein